MTRLRCAILDDYLNVALSVADWSKVQDRVDVTVFNEPCSRPRKPPASALKDSEIICAMRELTPFPRTMFRKPAQPETPDHLGHAQCRDRHGSRQGPQGYGVRHELGRDPTAPLTMGLILELTRNIGRENARMHAGEPLQALVGMEIEGRTLGVIGLGKLGTKVSKLAQAFGMNVIAWSPNLTPEKCKEVGVTYATKEDLFATADIVTIHVVLSQRSRGLVGRDELARMKPTAYLVNTARGPIVDEDALLEASDAKEDRGRRHRRVLSRAAAGRASVPQARQHGADAASRLRHRGQFSQPLPADGRGHRRLVQGRAEAAAGVRKSPSRWKREGERLEDNRIYRFSES